MPILPVKRQASLERTACCQGVALHSGVDVRMCLHPAPANSGIRFIRTDVTDRDNVIEVRADAVTDVRRCTTISNPADIQVSTIEHLMGALSACGIDNLDIEIDGPEVPAMDGSAEAFLKMIEKAGIARQKPARRYVRVLETIEVRDGSALVRIEPFPTLHLDVSIDFEEGAIGRQRIEIEPDVRAFRERLASARTFARAHEVVALQASGLSLGGSYDNAIVVDGDKVLNPGGLRHPQEFVRHKALDLLGDMYVGGPLLGRVTSVRAGHALNHKLLIALFADAKAWKFTHQPAEIQEFHSVSPLEQTASAL